MQYDYLAAGNSSVLSGKRVLVCEDEGMTVLMLQKALSRAGMQVVDCTRDGETAVHIAAIERPDIVLMDLSLSGMDGLAAARSILSQIDTCLVFLSGHSDQFTVEDALNAGAAGYLVKPVDSEQLLASLHRFCAPPESSLPA